jgi:FdrA protein
VVGKIRAVMEGIKKPVVSIFLGAEVTSPDMAATLEEGALRAVALSKGDDPAGVAACLSEREADLKQRAQAEAAKRKKGQKYVRGLFSGGTFCSEAQILFDDVIGDVYSNAPAGKARALADALKSQRNTVVDLGEDEFTVGRPHPMIDYSLRTRRLQQEANDPETAVILLDVVLGYGSHPDPAAELVAVVGEAAKKVAVVCSVTGTDRDPQNRTKVAAALEKAGAVVMPTNAAACKLAGYIVAALTS